MKKLRKIISLMLVCAMAAVLLAGCGGEPSTSSGQEGESTEGKTYELRLATLYPAEHELTVSAQAACDKIEQETNGAVKIQIYPSDQLGDYTSVYEEVMKGTIDMTINTMVTTYDPTLEMLTIPYLASSYEEAKEIYCNPDSYFFQTVRERQEALNIETLGIYISGAMGVGAAKHLDNVMDPTASKSALIRCPSMDSYLWTAEGFGFNTVTIAYSELYTALQTGVCDGWVGGGAYVNYVSFRDVLDYFCDARYIYENIVCIMNKDLFDGMPAEYQEIIQKAFTESTYSFTDQMEALDNKAMEDMAAMGIEIYSPTEEEYETMRAYFKENVWPKYENTLDASVYQALITNGMRAAA
ncbi:MAG: TRAP transporter substrate-binding protein DctP [Clostridiales bacterium]|nr:TRAP transporter substrate-binding protein DctP [Clostridiales bacterium]MDY4171257.1 TRAP transporter substrate-binding protein DctP [Evtepia sp.]